MKVDLKGQVLEKFSREYKTDDGKKYERLFLRLFQVGQRINVDVSVDSGTYGLYSPGDDAELQGVSLSTYNNMIFARME